MTDTNTPKNIAEIWTEHQDDGPQTALERELYEAGVKLVRDLDAAKLENQCDICLGTGTLLSGKPCACGGSGKMSDAAITFRQELAAANAELAELRPHIALDRAVIEDQGKRLDEAREELARVRFECDEQAADAQEARIRELEVRLRELYHYKEQPDLFPMAKHGKARPPEDVAKDENPPGKWVCIVCGCYWKKHEDGMWSLFDRDQKPLGCCDNNMWWRARLVERAREVLKP